MQFDNIELVFEKNPPLNIYAYGEGEGRAIFIAYDGEEFNINSKSDEGYINKAVRMIDREMPWLFRVGSYKWRNNHTAELHNLDQVLEEYSDHLPSDFKVSRFPDWLNDLTSRFETYFIQDQRLIVINEEDSRFGEASYTNTIEKYADDLSQKIRASSVNAASVSQRLDSTFPVRLLMGDFVFDSIEEINKALGNIQRKRNRLSNYDLISSVQDFPLPKDIKRIEDGDRKVLTLYISDTWEKLNEYEELFKKLNVFTRILNGKRLSFKKIKIDRDEGFFFEMDNGNTLKLSDLSSGEQHQVVLLYELIFKANENTIVLIDEPEISLHVAWQKEFLDDIKDIISLKEMKVVIATHSPQIVNSNWDLTVDLQGFEDECLDTSWESTDLEGFEENL